MHLVVRLISLAAAGLLLATPAWADEIFSLKAGYLVLSPEGEFAGNDGGVGTRVDMEDDLDMDDSEDFTVEAALQLGNFRLSAAYMPIEFSGSDTLTRDIVFNGMTFPQGTPADSDVDIDLYDIGLTWFLLNFDDLPARIQIGPEIAVKVADADLSLSNALVNESVSVTAPIPTIGLRARIALADFLGIAGRVGYVEYSDNSFLDADVQVELSPIPMVGVFGGYRYFDLQVDEDDVYLDAQFSGPYGGVFVRF